MDLHENDDPDGWMPYCDDEMLTYPGEFDPDGGTTGEYNYNG